MKKFLRDNSLSIVFFVLFLITWCGQVVFGLKEYNKEQLDEDAPTIEITEYLTSGHFVQSTFENWESEFLQMALFVILTIFLQQRGSSESKDFTKDEDVDREPSAKRKDVPWPVKAGGWKLAIYKHSLSIALVFLFVVSFIFHFCGSLNDENDQLALKNLPPETALEYAGDSRFWFESMQNWQSEFLSVFVIVIFSIWLRQKGSSQSKPVDAPHSQTGY